MKRPNIHKVISVGDIVRILSDGKDRGEITQVIGKMRYGKGGFLYKVKSSMGYGWFSRGDLELL